MANIISNTFTVWFDTESGSKWYRYKIKVSIDVDLLEEGKSPSESRTILVNAGSGQTWVSLDSFMSAMANKRKKLNREDSISAPGWLLDEMEAMEVLEAL